jgi:hypothetical protein
VYFFSTSSAKFKEARAKGVLSSVTRLLPLTIKIEGRLIEGKSLVAYSHHERQHYWKDLTFRSDSRKTGASSGESIRSTAVSPHAPECGGDDAP